MNLPLLSLGVCPDSTRLEPLKTCSQLLKFKEDLFLANKGEEWQYIKDFTVNPLFFNTNFLLFSMFG